MMPIIMMFLKYIRFQEKENVVIYITRCWAKTNKLYYGISESKVTFNMFRLS